MVLVDAQSLSVCDRPLNSGVTVVVPIGERELRSKSVLNVDDGSIALDGVPVATDGFRRACSKDSASTVEEDDCSLVDFRSSFSSVNPNFESRGAKVVVRSDNCLFNAWFGQFSEFVIQRVG